MNSGVSSPFVPKITTLSFGANPSSTSSFGANPSSTSSFGANPRKPLNPSTPTVPSPLSSSHESSPSSSPLSPLPSSLPSTLSKEPYRQVTKQNLPEEMKDCLLILEINNYYNLYQDLMGNYILVLLERHDSIKEVPLYENNNTFIDFIVPKCTGVGFFSKNLLVTKILKSGQLIESSFKILNDKDMVVPIVYVKDISKDFEECIDNVENSYSEIWNCVITKVEKQTLELENLIAYVNKNASLPSNILNLGSEISTLTTIQHQVAAEFYSKGDLKSSNYRKLQDDTKKVNDFTFQYINLVSLLDGTINLLSKAKENIVEINDFLGKSMNEISELGS